MQNVWTELTKDTNLFVQENTGQGSNQLDFRISSPRHQTPYKYSDIIMNIIKLITGNTPDLNEKAGDSPGS